MEADYISKERIRKIRSLIKWKYMQESSPNDRRSISNEKKSVFGDQIESRDEFSRDRDRILFSKAFRRLQHKAQVYSHEKGDHYRTRLTHTIETTQISRGIAKNLCLNENLAEAIALGHDIGHTPFGHEGEKVLDDILRGTEHLNSKIREGWPQIDFGGFKHNFNSVKILDIIENRYTTTKGLNLTWQVLEGILKHTKITKKGYEYDLERFIQHPEFIEPFITKSKKRIKSPMTLEGQVVNISDEIAQRQHDLDDGLRDAELDINDVIETVCTNIDVILNKTWKEIFQYYFNRGQKICSFQRKINVIFKEIIQNNCDDKDIRLKFVKLIYNLPKSKYTHEELLLLLELKVKIILLLKSSSKVSKTIKKDYQSSQLIRLIISYFIHDVTINTLLKIENLEKKSNYTKHNYLVIFGGKRFFKKNIVKYSQTGEKFDNILNNYIENRIVNSFNVNRFDAKSNYIIKRLFAAYYENPKQMSKESLRRLNEQIEFNCKEYYDIQFKGGPNIRNILFSPEPEDPLKLSHVNRLISILKFDIEFEDLVTPANFDEDDFWRFEEGDFWEDIPRLSKKEIKEISHPNLLENVLFIKCLIENHYALLSVITDNIAGMTDNYAKDEYKLLYLV